jgi:TPR repeat protein
MEGNVMARYNLGEFEENAGNYDRALKHFMIAVRGGFTHSVKTIQRMYMNGHAAKDDYANALRSHQAYLNEIKSDQRDKAAAFKDSYKYC